MPLSKEELEASKKILKALDEAIATGPWGFNALFQEIGKKLQDIKKGFIHDLGLDALTSNTPDLTEEETAKFTEVFVSLYQTEGTNLPKWQTVVNSLAGYNVTRPVYQNELDIQNAIKTKEFRQNDAYVAVKIRKEDVMPVLNEKPPTDRHGYPLVVLKEGAIKLENILRFSHTSGEYAYQGGALIKKI